MASEQEDNRDRQLEALRRHIVRLDSQWKPPTQLGVQGERLGDEPAEPAVGGRPPLRWLLLAGLLVVVALVGGVAVGAVAWSDNRPAPDASRTTAAGSADRNLAGSSAAVATPACKTAVDRANTMLASAVKLRGALAEHDRILNDPANRGLPVGQVLGKLAASQRVGTNESIRFDRALDAYRQVVDRCDLRVP
jgi:uncharacterized membrane protein